MKEHKLSDYSLIGNSRAAALVSKSGSIDWCCLPEFHSSSIFASILDKENGGHFSISPLASFKSTQGYLPGSNVVKTDFECEEGVIRLTDAFTIATQEAQKHTLFPEHEILRIVEGVSGNVRVKLEYVPKTFYGKYNARLEDRKKLGIHFAWKGHIYTLVSTLESQKVLLSDNRSIAKCEFAVKEGERFIFSLSYSGNSPAVIPELYITGLKRMNDTIQYWKEWIGKCKYSGVYEDEIRRSALVLKLLAHAPSGAIIAAPTTSLPEGLGGIRNWDYRYCWLRDASFTVNVLLKLGFEDETHAYTNWILHATQLTRPELQIMYSVYGLTSLKEQTLEWLKGYKNSSPVRIGNDAEGQFQLDVYGEVLDAIYTYSLRVKEFDRATRKFIIGLGIVICEVWEKPDNGIWEIRSSPVHHTHSKAMAWVGLDRIIKLSEKYNWSDAPSEKFREVASQIRSEVEGLGYNESLKSYTREFKGTTLDASLLTLSLAGYCDSNSDRMISTSRLIYSRLSKNNMIYRYLNDDDGLSGGEGAFGVCNFWLAENFARSGNLQKAVDIFEDTLKMASPTGLISEEIDPDTEELLGNYPQGFTHIGLISAALAINEAQLKELNQR